MEGFRDWLLSEMPITLQKVGGWGPKDPKLGYKSDDIGIMQSAVGVAKIQRKWSKTEFDFNTWICRSRNCYRARGGNGTGAVDEDFVTQVLGLKVVPNPTKPDEISIKPESINYIVTNNQGDERMPLNAWTLAHRFGHALQGGSGLGAGKEVAAWAYYTKELWNEIMQVFAGIYKPLNRGYEGFAETNSELLRQFCMGIGTMGSARNKRLVRYYEFTYELFAQYIIEGRVKFNDPPQYLDYRVRNEPNSPRSVRQRLFQNRYKSEVAEYIEYLHESLVPMIEYNLHNVLSNCVGRIFVM